MPADARVSMFDRVRVQSAPATRERGLAGLTGQVYGESTPSITGVEVIGQPSTDHAINVHFDVLGKGFWFAPDLLEFVDHASGTKIEIESKKWTRAPDGKWAEEK